MEKRRFILWMILFIVFTTSVYSQVLPIRNPVKFLALGDSYTVGQSVPSSSSWPAQLMDSLSSRGYEIEQLSIFATTGWRTDNLKNGLLKMESSNDYNLVSLLIGVNDQYQGISIDLYPSNFEELINMAIEYASGDTSSVFVLSIPDYAFTPFGQNMNSSEITSEINQYNSINSAISQEYGIAYFDITPISREGLVRPELVAGDGLHPSGVMYGEWVSLILQSVTGEPAASSVNGNPEPHTDVYFYPNPVRDQIHFIIENLEITNLKIRIFSIEGRLLSDISSGHETDVIINVEDFHSGVYSYQIISDREVLFTGKFVKN